MGWELWASALGTVLALAGLGRLLAKDLLEQLEDRLARADAVALERLTVRDQAIERLTAELARAHAAVPQMQARIDDLMHDMEAGYVSRETWLEHVGGVNIKLDRLKEELDRVLVSMREQG